MHFRKDSFFELWMKLQQATWDRGFLAGMLARTRQSYQQLAIAASAFPGETSAWQAASASDLQALFVAWWQAFVEFFSVSFFIQAQGDDIIYPHLRVALDDAQQLAARNGVQLALPSLADLTAPTSPVLTAEYMADLARLREALHAADCRTPDAARSALEPGSRHAALRACYAAVHARWFWMRERDPLYAPYDTLDSIVSKALNIPDSSRPSDYAANARNGRRALCALMDCAQHAHDADKLLYAAGFGHDLVRERENHHIVWLQHSYPFRRLCKEWERRLLAVSPLQDDDIFFFTVTEALEAVAALPQAPADELIARVHNRRAAYMREMRLTAVAVDTQPEDDYL